MRRISLEIERRIPLVCSCRVERKGAVGQGLAGLEKILLAVVAAVLRASDAAAAVAAQAFVTRAQTDG